MDLDVLGGVGIICIVLMVLFIEIGLVLVIASAFASYLGVSGLLWWAVVIISFLLINGVLGALGRVGR